MKTSKIVLMVFILMGIMPAAAIPGIQVTIDPLSIDAQSDTTVNYVVKITNEDDFYDKTITSLDMPVTQPGWIYSIDPPSTNTIPAGAGNFITTTLHITVPSGTTSNIYYSHRINAVAEFELYPGCLSETGDTSLCILTENDPEDFNTHVIEGAQNTEIPEFPSIALPVVGTIGLLFIMRRRK